MRREEIVEKEWWTNLQPPERRRTIKAHISQERRLIRDVRENAREQIAKLNTYIVALQNELERPDKELRMPTEIPKSL
jgi:hypothetical protein